MNEAKTESQAGIKMSCESQEMDSLPLAPPVWCCVTVKRLEETERDRFNRRLHG